MLHVHVHVYTMYNTCVMLSNAEVEIAYHNSSICVKFCMRQSE